MIDSIRQRGILQPILVRSIVESPGKYEIIAGERRWRAAQQTQLQEVPIIVRDLSDREALEVGLVENLQRQDLSPLEEAEGYSRLVEEFHHTQEELAQAIVSRGLNVRQTERLVQNVDGKRKINYPARPKDSDPITLERNISNRLGLKVRISFTGQRGNLIIHYNTLEQLDDILLRLNMTASPKPSSDPVLAALVDNTWEKQAEGNNDRDNSRNSDAIESEG